MAGHKKVINLNWVSVKGVSLATAARESGFDLAVYRDYSEQTQQELRKRTINQTLDNICDAYEDEVEGEKSLEDIEYGVYVIRLSKPLTIRYQKSMLEDDEEVSFKGTSQIVYIGRGNVRTRLKDHLQKKLFDFMLSLSGADFDFQILDPETNHFSKHDLHKQVEHDLLVQFSEMVTETEKGWPILNKNSGTDAGIEIDDKNLKYPLRRDTKNIEWIVEPTDAWRRIYLD